MQYSEREEKGYPLLFFRASSQWKLSLLFSLIILAASIGFFVWSTRVSDDMGGDSFAGLVFAVAGTIFMSLAAVGFSRRRHARKRSVGELNAVLNWHVCFGVLALVLLFLHGFGNYNPRSGTYALYAMIALVICGFIGRGLDRMAPRFMARQVRKALTAQGEDRIETISRNLQSTVVYNKQELRAFQATPPARTSSSASSPSGSNRSDISSAGQGILQSPWDMAYISLEETPQELRRDNSQYRFVPDRKSALTRPGALYPGAQEHISAIEEVQQALKQEAFFRYVIRFWRVFHIALAILTVGLTAWHIEYALTLIMPAIQKFGFGYLLPWP